MLSNIEENETILNKVNLNLFRVVGGKMEEELKFMIGDDEWEDDDEDEDEDDDDDEDSNEGEES